MSWKDPQIYLSSAANGKSASVHYDIVDFVDGGIEEEIIVGGGGSHFGDHLPSKQMINILHIILQVNLHDINYCHFIMLAYA